MAIGRALVRDVDVFLFDEPLSNLDAKLRSELRVEIKRLHNQLGNTMVYVTHDQIEALTLADRIAVMKGGVIQQLAGPQEIYNRPSNLFVAGFIGSPPMNFLHGRTIEGGKAFQFGATRIDLAGYEGGAILERDDAILGVRPEHITVSTTPVAGPSIPAEVEIDEHPAQTAFVAEGGRGEPECPRAGRGAPACGDEGPSGPRHPQGLAFRHQDGTEDLTHARPCGRLDAFG